MMRMETLSRKTAERLLPQLIAISADVSPWGTTEFLTELPGKWELSFTAWQADQPVGYAILSRKFPGRIHIHQFMVAPSQRGSGIGIAMLAEARRRADSLLSLKVHQDNHGAIRFYEREGLRREQLAEAYWLMLDRRAR
jgi:ribosomal protein S18 acetylase RimI-like enzyme